MILVRNYLSKHLLVSDVNHSRKRLVAREKWSQFGLVHHEIKRSVYFGVTLLHGPLVHPENQFLLVTIIKDGRIGYSVEAWSFVQRFYWELVVWVVSPLFLVCS